MSNLTGSAPWSAPGAKTAKDQFTFTKNALTESAGAGPGNVVPRDVFNITATIADEVVMADTFGIELGGATFDGNFTD